MHTIFAAHIDDKRQGIAHTHWTSHTRSTNAIAILDLHIALRWAEGEDYRISRCNSVKV